MSPIKAVSVGWKALETILNAMVDAINRRTIIRGAGLSTQETDNGILIWVTKAGDDQSAPDQSGTANKQPWLTTPDGEIAQWHKIGLMDANCNQTTIYVWSGSIGGNPG
jgi:hypothetical protein